jgi:hypothetical protein
MPDMNMMGQQRPDDQEAAMARADLYKTANYSFKLFKMIKDGDQLEGWVQAKITKAADYVASVYHYMEYEMKFSEYGKQIENADMYSESVRREFKKKLTEAKVKLEKLNAKNQKELDEVFSSDDKVGSEKKTRTGVATKTSTGLVHKNTSYKDGEDEIATNAKSGKGTKSHAKGQSAAEKKDRAPALKQSKTGTWGMKDSQKFDNRKVKEAMAPMEPDGATAPPPKGKDGQYPIVTSGPHKGKRWSPQTPGPTNPAMKEGAKPDFLDMDKDGNKKEPMKKAVADKKATESLKGGQKKLDKNHNGKLDGDDFKKLRGGVKESEDKCNHTAAGKKCPVHGMKECSGMYEASHQEKTTMKHVKNPTAGEKKAAKDIKAGTAGYADRAAMLKSAEKDGRLKEASKPSAGMSAAAKSALAKKASAGKDIGKPGKSFDKVAKAAGGGEKGKKIAAAAMWKNAAR